MIVSIHQPNFLPWPGFFHKMMAADVFILLDKVQYVKNALFNRNKIKTPHGVLYLTVPVHIESHTDAYDSILIDQTSGGRWARKHLKSIEWAYRECPYFNEYFPGLEEIYCKDWWRLLDLNLATIRFLCESLRVETRILFESELRPQGTGTARLVSLCEKVQASAYLSGDGSPYLEERLFAERGIDVNYQRFLYPVYPQVHGGFASHLSMLDMLFNCGAKSKEILLRHQVRDHQHLTRKVAVCACHRANPRSSPAITAASRKPRCRRNGWRD
jgi:hypothetical protein